MPNDGSYVTEGKDVKVEYGVAMLEFDIKNWDKITSVIKKEDVYDKPTFGIEDEPHITILYGFHDNVKPDQVKKIIHDVVDKGEKIKVEIKKISFFEVKGQEYDVVKFDVESPILHKLNKALKELPHTSSFTDYHPHMTISYVKKGTAKKYEKKLKNSLKLQSDNICVFDKEAEKDNVKRKSRNSREHTTI